MSKINNENTIVAFSFLFFSGHWPSIPAKQSILRHAQPRLPTLTISATGNVGEYWIEKTNEYRIKGNKNDVNEHIESKLRHL